MRTLSSIAVSPSYVAQLVAAGQIKLPGTAKPEDVFTVPVVQPDTRLGHAATRERRHQLATRILQLLKAGTVPTVTAAADYLGTSYSSVHKAWGEYGPVDWTRPDAKVQPLKG